MAAPAFAAIPRRDLMLANGTLLGELLGYRIAERHGSGRTVYRVDGVELCLIVRPCDVYTVELIDRWLADKQHFVIRWLDPEAPAFGMVTLALLAIDRPSAADPLALALDCEVLGYQTV